MANRFSKGHAVAARSLAQRLRIPAASLLTGYWIALFISTHLPHPERFIPADLWDKGLHFVAYGGLAALMLFNLLLRGPLRWSRVAAIVAAVATIGLLDEVTQIPVGRSFDLLDLLADVIGAIAATTIMAAVVIVIQRPPRREAPQI